MDKSSIVPEDDTQEGNRELNNQTDGVEATQQTDEATGSAESKPEIVESSDQPIDSVYDTPEVVSTDDTPTQNAGETVYASNDKVADTITTEPEPVAAPIIAASVSHKKRNLILAGVFVLALLAGFFIAWQFTSRPAAQTNSQVSSSSKSSPKLGVSIALVDGTAKLKPVSGDWRELKAGQTVAEGSQVQTDKASRVVLAFDDGSALRLDASTTVKLDSLDPKNIKISQLAGTAYSRVVPSERKYVVAVDSKTYTAEGTAFSTTNNADEKGVQVYQSAVKVSQADTSVAEGKQFYDKNKDAKLEDKVTDIDLKGLEGDDFIKWNIDQDKKHKDFKDKLGVLAQVGIEQKDESDKPTNEQPTVPNALQLTGSAVSGGAQLSWTLNGVSAPSGFKLLRSQTTSTPTYGVDEYKYISAAGARSYTWSSSKSGTYWFRACIYVSGKCTNYSNSIQLTVTASEKDDSDKGKVTRGSMSLSVASDGKATWSYTGKAIYGYKLVYSKDPSPVYPGDDYKYYSDSDTTSGTVSVSNSGNYYVRVCAYTNGTESDKCVDYSNQVYRYISKN